MISALSIGNMGGSSVYCEQNKLKFDTIHMYCPSGVLDTEPMYFGLISSEIVNQV